MQKMIAEAMATFCRGLMFFFFLLGLIILYFATVWIIIFFIFCFHLIDIIILVFFRIVLVNVTRLKIIEAVNDATCQNFTSSMNLLMCCKLLELKIFFSIQLSPTM